MDGPAGPAARHLESALRLRPCEHRGYAEGGERVNELVRFDGAHEPRRVPRLEKPFKLTICVTQTCSMNCKLCYADCGSSKRPELTTEQWKTFIDQLVAEEFIHIFFEGGEPFHRPDFEDILA